jgi:hypothetical protein
VVVPDDQGDPIGDAAGRATDSVGRPPRAEVIASWLIDMDGVLDRYPYRPSRVVESLEHLLPDLEQEPVVSRNGSA